MIGYKQTKYAVQITTPLGPDVLLVDTLDGDEAISSLFEFRLRLLSENSNISFESLVGQTVTVSIALPTGQKKYVNALVGKFRHGGVDGRLAVYYADLYPKLWLLTHTCDHRIFQNQSVPDIIKALLSAGGITDVKDSLTGTYASREYCVQYGESSFAFVSRLMESEGIFYFFDHSDAAHTLVLADDSSAYPEGPARMRTTAAQAGFERFDAINDFSLGAEVTAGQYKSDDYNFEMPATDLLGLASSNDTTLSVYQFPAGRTEKDAVESIATRRLEQLELPSRTLQASSWHAGFRAGCKFAVTDHPREDFNGTYILSRVSHRANQESYSNSFQAFPVDRPFRPERTTPLPRIVGCQTAVVVGKSGEEIWTDQYGRIKVKFHWDQSEASDETSSCWIRVAQGWAGKNWGSVFLPRIGQEVVVTFVEGDPDRPLITGSVYNSQQTVPYTLPDEQTKSTIKSQSSKGGGGFNEIRFEDKKGSEEVFVQAQKDMNVSVLNNRTLTVAVNDSETVKGTRTVQVTGAETHTNSANVTYTINEDLTITVGGAVKLAVTGNVTLEITGNLEVTALNINQSANAAISSKANATHNVEAGAVMVVKGALVKIN